MAVMNKRIDYFAMAAMDALINMDRFQLAVIKAEEETGETRDVILAKWAYKIAEAMEAEAALH